MFKKIAVVLALVQVLTITTTSTAEAQRRRQSPMDRAVAQCAGAVIGGAILGAIIGNNTGSGRGGRGAVAGAALGAVACAIIMANNSRENRQRMAEAEEIALNEDESQYQEYRDEQGRRRTLKVDVEPTSDPSPPRNAEPRVCRMRQTTLGLNGDET